MFIAATVHGLMSGTDSALPWMLGIYIVSAALVVGVASRRFLSGPNAPLKRRRAARRPVHVEHVPPPQPVHVDLPPLPPLDQSGDTQVWDAPVGATDR